MVEILTNEEFEKMKAAGKILQHVFKACRDEIKPGISTHDVDKLCYDIIRSYDAIPSFLNYGQPPFPGTICASVNDEVVHGIPRKTRILQEGDIISVDVGAILDGYQSDACRTYMVGNVAPEVKDLVERTEKSFFVPKDEIAENDYDLSINKYKKIEYIPVENGCYTHIRCLDTKNDLMDLKLFAPDMGQAKLIGEKIMLNPAGFYGKVIELALSNEEIPYDLTDN